MSKIQRVIKYLAIAFALFLTFSIISGIASGLIVIGDVFDNKENYEILEELKDLGIENDAKVLDINIASSSIIIKVGDTFKAETSNKYIECKQDKDRIFIKEKNTIGFL